MAYEEKEYAQSFDWRGWGGLMPFLRPYRKTIALVVVFNLLCALIDILLPLFQRYAIDHFIEEGTTEGMFGFGVAYFASILLQALFVILFTRGSMRIEMYFGRDLKRACFVHLQTLSFSYYNVTPVGYIHSRVMSDTNRIATMTAWNLFDMLWSLAYVLGVFVAMLLLNVQLALLIILVVPAIAALTWYFQNRILHWNRKVRKLNSKITGAFNEGITGAKTSKTLVIEEQNHRQFRELTEEMRASSVRAARLSAVYIPLVLFVSSAATAVVLARGGFLVGRNLLLLGTLSAFTSYAVGIFEPIQQFARNLADFISMQASMERVTGLLHEVPQVVDAAKAMEDKCGRAVPVIAAGGVYSGADIMKFLELGASGVQMGTRFLTAHECNVHPIYKERVLKAKDIDTTATGKRLGHPVRCLKTPFSRKIMKLEADSSVPAAELEAMGVGALRKAVQEGDLEHGTFMSGQIAGMIHKEQSCAEIIREMMDETEQILRGAAKWIK